MPQLNSAVLQQWLRNMYPQGAGPTPQPTVPLRRPTAGPAAISPLFGGGTLPTGGTLPPVAPASGRGVMDPWALRATGQMPTVQPGVARQIQDWAQQQQAQSQMTRQLQTMAPGVPKEDLWTMYRRQLGLEPGLQEPMSEYQQEMMAFNRIQELRLREQMGATQAYQQQTLAQSSQQAAASQAIQWAQMEAQRQAEAAQLAQRKREMGAGIGQGIAQMQAQTWAQGMPYALPKGTMFAPGFEPGDAASALARMGGARYTPQVLAPTPAPSRKEMESWIADAIAKFGGG